MKMILTAAVAISWLLAVSTTFASHHSDGHVAKFIAPDGKVTELMFEDREKKKKDCSGYAGPEVRCWKLAKKGDDVSDKKLVAHFILPNGKEHLLVPRSLNSGKNLGCTMCGCPIVTWYDYCCWTCDICCN